MRKGLISRSIQGLKPQVIQHLGSWSEHVSGWTSQKKIPVIIITFEQLLKNSSIIFRNLLSQLKIPYEEKTITAAGVSIPPEKKGFITR